MYHNVILRGLYNLRGSVDLIFSYIHTGMS
jgi:hypothetical protein